MEDVSAKYVSQKVSKTRWRPVPAAALQPPEVFATGSWDNEENKISVWSVGDFEGLDPNGEYHGEPRLLCDIQHSGDVMDMQFLDQERIVTASSTGSVNIFRHHQNNQSLSISQKWENAHYYVPHCRSACTGVICNSPEIFTVGEDGRINMFTADRKDAVRTVVWEVHFHPSNPDHLFTCSEDGSLWHWDASTDVSERKSFLHTGGRNTTYLPHTAASESVISAWLSNDPTKDRMEITNLISNPTLSVNSLDILGSCLVYGTDAESIYVKKNLFA
uniref:Nucleoporin 43 n=1 Tax=Varanus komodoensis TaxID=61221 RepID=A0A8D2LYN5_VARKO